MEKEFIKFLNDEGKIAKTIFISLVTSLLLFGILYFMSPSLMKDILPKYGIYLFFLILSYALIMPSVKYVKAYGEFACMSGMMIGMTLGMIAGFLSGFYVGATNGMFWGSVFGIIVGMFFGIWTGKCCGIMGIMEGSMAGFMGGLMGAMTAVMMYNDNLKLAGIIVFAISGFILMSLNYMIYKESKEMERKETDELFNVVLSGLLSVLSIIFMFFGPRSVLLQ